MNNKDHTKTEIGMLGAYIQNELTQEMSTPEKVEQRSKVISQLASAEKGEMEGKKIIAKVPFSDSKVTHDAIKLYFSIHDVRVVEKY